LTNYDTVKEVGFEFQIRKHGKSKLGFKNISNYIHHLLSLAWRTKEIYRFAKFCIIGGIGTIVNLLVLYLLHDYYNIDVLISGAIGIEAGLITNFIFNKVWTFKDIEVKGSKAILIALVKDHIVRSGGIILNLVILWLLTSVFGVYYLISQVIGILVAMIWNFAGNKWFTWE